MDNMSLATELLHELKLSAKRWFIAFCIMVIVEVCTVAGFLWYLSLPVESETITMENDEGNTMYVGNDVRGGVSYGSNNSEENTAYSAE